jgi:hypothetical protein
MAERVGLKCRNRMSKEQLIEALGLRRRAVKKRAARGNEPLPANTSSSLRAAVRPATSRPPVGLEGSEISQALVSSLRERNGDPRVCRGTYLDRGPDLLAGYGDDRIVALVRDPRNLFVYWELAGGAYERAAAELGRAAVAGALWVLRIVRMTDGRFFDIAVDPAAGNWYLQVEAGCRYQVKVGLVLSCDVFLELAASAEVATPPETASDRIDEEWMLLSEELGQLMKTMLRELGRRPGSEHMLELSRRRAMFKRLGRIFPWNISSGVSSRVPVEQR